MEKFKELKSSNPKAYIASSICSIIFSAILAAFPIAMVVIGSQHQNECTIERMIPIWLIVSGSVGIFLSLVCVLTLITQLISERGVLTALFGCFTFLVSLFQLAWFIAGNVWVYSKTNLVEFDDILSPYYCDKTLYLFSFWSITATYILIGVCIIGGICCGCVFALCACCCVSKKN